LLAWDAKSLPRPGKAYGFKFVLSDITGMTISTARECLYGECSLQLALYISFLLFEMEMAKMSIRKLTESAGALLEALARAADHRRSGKTWVEHCTDVKVKERLLFVGSLGAHNLYFMASGGVAKSHCEA
jgi:hypothetical protein